MGEDYYKILNVDRNVSSDEIKKSYKQLAKKYHPDRKGGDEEMFKKINNAYEILNDPEKRNMYDTYGENFENMSTFSNDFSDPLNMFNNVFGNLFGFGNSTSTNINKRTKDKKMSKTISLENLYCGTGIKFVITRSKICKTCDGSGCNIKSSSYDTRCDLCDGSGFKKINNYTSISITCCSKCSGTGKYIPRDKICKTCKGDKVVNKKEQITINIPKGFDENYIVLESYSDEYPNCETGDLIVYFKLKSHKTFLLDGRNLHMKKEISLKDALCGFSFDFKHLDDTTHHVEINELITPEYKKTIKNLGMCKTDGSFGDLFIKFNIIFPTSLDQKTKDTLSEIL